MLETSRDILNIVIAVSVAVFTFFICWLIYYLIKSFKDIFQTVEKVKNSVNKAEEILETIKDKVNHGFGNMFVIAEAAKKVFDFVKDLDRRKKEKRREEEESSEEKF